MIHLVVFSHLRYGSVRQRPHHIVERLAKEWEVLFVEEPEADPKTAGVPDFRREGAHLTVFTPHRPWDEWKAMTSYYVKPIRTYINRLPSSDEVVFWFYSPNYVRILNYFAPDLTVYDCMDEHAAFANASPNLGAYERRLIAQSSVVFAGGKSLYESKSRLHSQVHCFPSSVSTPHFARAYDPATVVPPDIAAIAHPIAGYYGVIDERMDMELVKKAAAIAPDISFVFIGPLAKIGEGDLARAPNIHYLGEKQYGELPAYLKAFDVAMIPFYVSPVTEYLSPTKTLEFMAALKPIVATPIRDIVRDYSSVVSMAYDATSFVSSIRRYMAETTEMKTMRQAKEMEITRRTSWDATVREMKRIVQANMRTSGTVVRHLEDETEMRPRSS